MLAQPRPVLARMLLRRIDAPLLGDLVFGPLLFALSGHASLETWPTFIAVTCASALLMLGFCVATQAWVFFLRGRSEGTDLAFNAIMVFSMYPATMFSGALQVLLYTVVPAAFIGTVPVHLVLDPGWNELLAMVAIVVAIWSVALATWRLGLRRYLRDGLGT
jgi:ABC-2 type transport system permease protein